MEFKDLLEQVEIEGAGQGDVVFIEVPDGTTVTEYEQFSNRFREHAKTVRAEGFFPRCIILPPGFKAEVARAQLQDRIEIRPAALDAGLPHG